MNHMLPIKKMASSLAGQERLRIIAMVMLSLLVSIGVNRKIIHSFAITGDNFALLLHSAALFDVSPVDWMSNGFRYYFNVYPELFRDLHYFIRPTQNLLIYLLSLEAATPNAPIFLIAYYGLHSLNCALVYLFCRWCCGLRPSLACLTALTFWGSLASAGVYTAAPAFGGDALAACLGMGALLVSHLYLHASGRGKWLLFSCVVGLLLLALYAKETVITAPLIVVIYWIWERLRQAGLAATGRHSLTVIRREWARLLLLLALPILYLFHLVLLRLLYKTGVAVYPLHVSLLNFSKAPLYTGLSIFFPVEQQTVGLFIKSLLNGEVQSLLVILRHSTALFLNLTFLMVLLVKFRQARLVSGQIDGRLALISVFGALAMLLPFFLAPEARFMYFGQMFTLPLLFYMLAPAWDIPHGARRGLVTAVFLLFILLNPVYLFFFSLPKQQNAMLFTQQASRELQAALLEELRDPQLRRVYLLNNLTSPYAGLAELQLIAARSGRDDVQLRVVNSLAGYNPTHLPTAGTGVQFAIQQDQLCVTTRIEQQTFDFAGTSALDLDQLGMPGIIDYTFGLRTENQLSAGKESPQKCAAVGGCVEANAGEKGAAAHEANSKELTACIPHGRQNDLLLIGFDPANPGVHLWRPTQPLWQPVRTGAGMQP